MKEPFPWQPDPVEVSSVTSGGETVYCGRCGTAIPFGIDVGHNCLQKLLKGARQITIAVTENNAFTVSEGEYFADGLTFDEMLGQVVELLHPDIAKPRYRMMTAEEWNEWNRRVTHHE